MHAVHAETPSRGLLGAVLERAMRDAMGPLGTGSTACTPRERVRVRQWFRASSVEPMSFRWLCLVLDLDPDTVVQRLELPAAGAEGDAGPSDQVEGENGRREDQSLAFASVGTRAASRNASRRSTAVAAPSHVLPRCIGED
jgi:hypothetical protein